MNNQKKSNNYYANNFLSRLARGIYYVFRQLSFS